MKITFSRTGERRYTTSIVRDDGVELKVPSYHRSSWLPHDLAHFVVERELGLRRGFWGRVADGALFKGIEILDGRRPTPDAAAHSKEQLKLNQENAVEAEVLVSSFIELVEKGIPPASVAAQARLAQRWMPQHPDARPLKSADIQRVCAALLAARQRFQKLVPGASFEVEWLRTKARKHRHR